MDAMEIHNQDNILDNDLILINFRVKQFYLMLFFSEPTVMGIQEGAGLEEDKNLGRFSNNSKLFFHYFHQYIIRNGNLTSTLEQGNTSIEGIWKTSKKKLYNCVKRRL